MRTRQVIRPPVPLKRSRSCANVELKQAAMHASDRQPVEAFNTLIGVNNNRVECYAFAIRQNHSAVLNVLLSRLVDTSLFCNEVLSREVYKLGGVPHRGTLASPGMLAAWQQMQEAAQLQNNRSMARACFAVECLTAISYSQTALRFDGCLNSFQKEMIASQVAQLRNDLVQVTNLSDVFEPAFAVAPVKRIKDRSLVRATIQVIEPFKTASRRIITALATGGSNFGPSIR